MPTQETNIYALAAAKQTAKGTAATAPTKRLLQVAGDFDTAQDLGNESWSNLGKYSGNTDWVNSVLGTGTPGVEADLDGLAYLMWLFSGSETVTTNVVTATLKDHVVIPSNTPGPYSTWWKTIGLTAPKRERFDDCRIGQVQLEGSTANKAIRVTPTVMALDPAKNLAADPTWPALPDPKTVLLFTEAAGAFMIDGVVIRGHSQFTVVLNENIGAKFTDDTVPYDVQRQGEPVATIAVTIEADAAGTAQYNKLLYGTATPTAGQAPMRRVPALGAYQFTMNKVDTDGTTILGGFRFEMPGVRWTKPDYPGPQPGGGDATLALAGSMRLVSGQPEWRTTVTNGLAAYTA